MRAKCPFLVKELSRTRVVGSHMASQQILGVGTKSFENNAFATMLTLLKDLPLFLIQYLLCDNHPRDFFQVLEKMIVSKINIDFGFIRLLI